MINENKKTNNIIISVTLVGALILVTIVHFFIDKAFDTATSQLSEHREFLETILYSMEVFFVVLTVIAVFVFLRIVLPQIKLANKDIEKYLLALESTTNHIVITDNNGIILYANKGAQNITGYTAEEMIGNTPRLWGGLMPISHYKDLWQTIKYDRKTFSVEVKNRRKNQDEYYALMHISPIVDKDGNLTGFVSTEEDITSRKQIEEDLKNAKRAAVNVLEDLDIEKSKLETTIAKDEAMLSSIGDGIIATGPNRRIILMNKQAEKLLGWKIDEAIGKLYDDIILLEGEKGTFVPPDKKPLHLAFDSGDTTTTTTGLYIISKNKIKFPVAITVSPIVMDNKIIGAVEVFRDITREKEIEKLRTDFLSLASHQFRTPLTGTKWLIENIKEGITGKINEKQEKYFDSIYQLNERMIKLVADMLNILRFESGPLVLKKEIVPISSFYENLMSKMTISAKVQGGVVLRNFVKDNNIISVETDLKFLTDIIENFLSNAIFYSMPGQEVILDAKEEDGAIVLSVKDTGIGIPKEEQKSIFEKFFRAQNAKKLRPTGTGLGMYLALTLANKIGAQISFDSEEGKGSTFYLTIPKK